MCAIFAELLLDQSPIAAPHGTADIGFQLTRRELPAKNQEILMRISTLHARLCALTAAAAVLITACATPPTIHRDTNPAANFGSYKTFGFLSPLATDKFPYESLLTQHLKDATRLAMESKGYVFSNSSPDLLLNFYVNIQDKQDVRATPGPPAAYVGYPGGYYGYRSGYYRVYNTTTIETINYKQGTLTVDLVDAKQKILAWTATAEGRVSNDALKNPGPAIDTLVANMMTPVPSAH
jgi:hypothetical protein